MKNTWSAQVRGLQGSAQNPNTHFSKSVVVKMVKMSLFEQKTLEFPHCVFLFILQLIIAHWLGRLSNAMFSKWFDVILLVNVYVNICPTFIKTFRIYCYPNHNHYFALCVLMLHFQFFKNEWILFNFYFRMKNLLSLLLSQNPL